MVDIDRAELSKPTLSLHRPIHADLRQFFPAAAALPLPVRDNAVARSAYLAHSQARAQQYPVFLPEYVSEVGPMNPYAFGHMLFEEFADRKIVGTGKSESVSLDLVGCRIIKKK